MPEVFPSAESSRPSPAADLGCPAVGYVLGDEALLREALPATRAVFLSERCVSYGVGVGASAQFVLRARQAGLPAVRRRTGGGGLLHEVGDLGWSVVLPRSDPRVGASFTAAYPRLGEPVVQWLSDRGMEARWVPAPQVSAAYCMLSDRGTVLEVDGRIVGGAAQHLVGARLLHHGTLALTVDRPTIDRIFELPDPGPSARLGGLRDLGLAGRSDRLARELAGSLADGFRDPVAAGSAP